MYGGTLQWTPKNISGGSHARYTTTGSGYRPYHRDSLKRRFARTALGDNEESFLYSPDQLNPA